MPDGPPLRDRWVWLLGGLYLLFFLAQTPLGFAALSFDVHDEGGKYVYLPSMLFDQDLDFLNQAKGYNQAFTLTPTGLSRADWSIGPALLWGPFFLAGHLTAHLLQGVDPGLSLDGYSLPYYLGTCLGTLCYGWLGLLLLYSLLGGIYGRSIGACAAALAFFSSLVPYYTFARPLHDHGLSAFAVSACLWSYYRLASAPSETLRWALLGMTTGLVAAIRVNDVFFLLPVCVAAIPLLKGLPGRAAWKGAGAFLLFFLLFYGPQLLANRIIWGTWIGTRDDADLGINLLAKTDWTRCLLDARRWRAILLGARYGILLQMPFVILGLWGLALRFRKDPFPTLGWISYLVMLMAGMLIWSDLAPGGDYWGENYGFRYTCSAVPILALGAAETLRSWRGSRWGWGLAALLIAWQASQLAQIGFCRRYDSPDWTLRAALELPGLLREHGALLYVRRSSLLGLLLSETPLGPWRILLHLAAPALLLAGFIALTGRFRSRFAGRTRLLLSAGILLVLPALWIEARHPRKSPGEIYAALVTRVMNAMIHPFGNQEETRLLERGRRMASDLGEDPATLDILDGYVQFRLGRLDEAELLWKGVLEREGDDPLAVLGLARLSALRGDPAASAAYVARVSGLPGHSTSLELAEWLSVDERK